MLRPFRPLLPANVLDVVVRAFCLIRSRALGGVGRRRGRDFERLFYGACHRGGLSLTEQAGARTVGGQQSASGFWHEVDAASRSIRHVTHWELKHLSAPVAKNDLLIFNGKGLEFHQGSDQFVARVPLLRFLLSGGAVEGEGRQYGALWGIMVIEPDRFPLPLVYEASVRGAAEWLSPLDVARVKDLVAWACRPLQVVLQELGDFSVAGREGLRTGPTAVRAARAVVDIQARLGEVVLDQLEEEWPGWVDETSESTWGLSGCQGSY
ncbi:MAG: hypothetical protein HY294_15010 [Candidatus Rokubacteria bacterium]|nr:hypothetical protein [Candidatus Rokubacteria bacterium]